MRLIALGLAAVLATSPAFAQECPNTFVSEAGSVIDWETDWGQPGFAIDYQHADGRVERCDVWRLSEGDWPFSLQCETFKEFLSYNPENNDQMWLGSDSDVFYRRCD